jgi:hypothetical protein
MNWEVRGVDTGIEVLSHAGADRLRRAMENQLVDHVLGDGRQRRLAVAPSPRVPHRLEHWRPAEPFMEGAVDGHIEVSRDVATMGLPTWTGRGGRKGGR